MIKGTVVLTAIAIIILISGGVLTKNYSKDLKLSKKLFTFATFLCWFTTGLLIGISLK
jgi:hypothetical protein